MRAFVASTKVPKYHREVPKHMQISRPVKTNRLEAAGDKGKSVQARELIFPAPIAKADRLTYATDWWTWSRSGLGTGPGLVYRPTATPPAAPRPLLSPATLHICKATAKVKGEFRELVLVPQSILGCRSCCDCVETARHISMINVAQSPVTAADSHWKKYYYKLKTNYSCKYRLY